MAGVVDDIMDRWQPGGAAAVAKWMQDGVNKLQDRGLDFYLEDVEQADTPVPVPEHEVLSWDKYRGQEALKTHMRIRVASAVARSAAVDPVLLVAEPGAGKTTLAKLIAHELDRPLLTVTKPLTGDNLITPLRRLGPLGVLFVDEVHLWSQKAQHDLMQLAEQGTLDGQRFVESFDRLTVMVATTEPQKLVGPLMSRQMVRPRWEPYSTEDLGLIINDMADNFGVGHAFREADRTGQGLTRWLVRASGGSPRQARMLAVAARDLSLAGLPLQPGLVLEFAGVEPDGLTSDHLAYLTALANQRKSTAGQNALAAILNIPAGQVRGLERLLLDNQMIELSGQGRMLTGRGLNRIKETG